MEKHLCKMLNRIKLIVAYDKHYGIGRRESNSIPWLFQEDINYFMDMTGFKRNGHMNSVIMGRNTWNSIPIERRGLKNRINIIISRTMNTSTLKEENKTESAAYIAFSVEDAVNIAKSVSMGDIYICGGGQIYSDAMEKIDIDEYYLTEIQDDFDTDVIFDKELLNRKIYDNDYSIKKSLTLDLEDKLSKRISKVRFITYSRNDICDKYMVMNLGEKKYIEMLNNILSEGYFKEGRNGGTYSSFGGQIKFNLTEGFPLLTSKRVFFKGICEELFFFLNGKTNSKILENKGVNIWRPNTSREFLDKSGLSTYVEGEMGPMYGFNWRFFGAEYIGCNEDYKGEGFDQFAHCIHLLKTDPFSRRILMTTFNPSVASKGVLYPCHGIMVLFNVREIKLDETYLELSCMMTQRSADMICGIPFNIASYALLVHILCNYINNSSDYYGPKYMVGSLILDIGDMHIYDSHRDASIRSILREINQLPQLEFINPITDIENIKFSDIKISGYNPNNLLKVEMVA